MSDDQELPKELRERKAPEVFTPIPPEWETRLHEFRSLAEMKVVFYVLRHTYGFREYDSMKRITMDELMHGRKRKDGSRMDAGTGEAKSTLKIGIRQAIEDKFLYVLEDRRDKGRIAKYYAIRLDTSDDDNGSVRGSDSDPGGPKTDPLTQSEGEGSLIRGSESDPARSKTGPGGVKADPQQPESDRRSEIGTPERYSKRNTQRGTVAASPRSPDGSPPPIQEQNEAMSTAERYWQRVKEEMKDLITTTTWQSWFPETRGLRLEGDTLIVRVPSASVQAQLEHRFAREIVGILQNAVRPGLEVRYTLEG